MKRRCFLSFALAAAAMPGGALAATAHAFSFENIDGGTIDLSGFAGRPVLVVNTASRCGFTYQYDGLRALYDRYRDRGFVVLAVPSDDFGGQELDTEAEVKDFCEVNFALDIPMTGITTVRGRSAHPFYRWALRELGTAAQPRWNFHKYLVAPDGTLVGAFPHTVEPEAPRVLNAIEALLPAG